jgi:hypothetical protein
MKLSQLTAKPQLIEVSIDDEDTIKEFGEAITFYTWDRQPMDTFVKLANLTSENDSKNIRIGDMIEVVRTLVLDEKGKEIISKDNTLPVNVLTKVIQKVTETLGK